MNELGTIFESQENAASPSTPVLDEWVTAVITVIDRMSAQLGEPHELRDISRSVFMSPFHFHRVFHMVTSSTPGRFLTALRIAKAKQLLLETDLTCTDVSIAIGYSSFGTFTTQFTKLVGMPPGKFRSSVSPIADVPVRLLLEQLATNQGPRVNGVAATIGPRPDGLLSCVVVGVFTSGIPQHRPVDCAIGQAPGIVRLGRRLRANQVFAVSAAPDATVSDVLAERASAVLCVGTADHIACCGQESGVPEYHVELRERQQTDPPVIVGFPLLGTPVQSSGSSGLA